MLLKGFHHFSFDAGPQPNILTDQYAGYFFHAGIEGSEASIPKSKTLSASALALAHVSLCVDLVFGATSPKLVLVS